MMINCTDIKDKQAIVDILHPPLVSVLLPVYNGERYLRQAIASICNQSWTDFELIVVDDGSIDNTPAILTEAVAQDARLVLLRHHQNQGLVTALNYGLTHARGHYIARQDADDWSFPDRLAKQVQFLDAHPNVAVVGTAAYAVQEGKQQPALWSRPTHPVLIGWRQLFASQLIHTSVMFRRQVVMAAGGYSEQFPHAEDYELWTRLSATQTLTNLADVLVTRRPGIGVASRNQVAQRRSVIQLTQQAMSMLLGHEVSWEEIEAVYHNERNQPIGDPVLVWRVMRLYQRLYGAYQRRTPMKAEAQHLVQAEFQQQIRRLRHCNAPLPRWLQAYWAGIYLWQKVQKRQNR